MTKRINISIPNDLDEFLRKNPDLSPSKMFQAKCFDIQQQRKDYDILLKRKQIILDQMGRFINHKGLWKEFQEWKTYESVPNDEIILT